MLLRENRLSADFDYRRLRRDGRRYGNYLFTFFVLPDPRSQGSPARFGFVVSSRVSKLATGRNRIKRIIREEVQNLIPRIRLGTLAAFWVRTSALNASPEDLRRGVREVLSKAGVYH